MLLYPFLVLQVNFSYFEAGESKQALVKLVVCERLAPISSFQDVPCISICLFVGAASLQ